MPHEPLIARLLEICSHPVAVASIERSDFPIVALAHIQNGNGACQTLAELLGEDTIVDLQRAISRGDSAGRLSDWAWGLVESNGDRYIIVERPTIAMSASIPGDVKQHTDLISAYVAALEIASELSLKTVLQRLVDLAREVVPARYAALGVSNEQGRILQFITSGISQAERAAIGDPPRGHGLLGALIRERKPIRVDVMSEDGRSVGFPPNHPPMRGLLGVPITFRNKVLGNLYLTERVDGDSFSDEDQANLLVLAAYAGAAIDRATLFREVEAASLRRAEQRDQLRVILNNLPSGVLIQSAANDEVELANNGAIEMLLGSTSGTGQIPTYGRDYTFLAMDGTDLPYDERPGTRAMKGTIVRNQQLSLSRKDGRVLPLLCQATPLRDADGTIRSAVIVLQDVTRLKEAEQLKDDFMSLISHEFRTPLTAIHGGAYLLSRQGDSLDEATRLDLLGDIVTESDRLERMMSNMLSLVAIQAGRLRASTEPVLVDPLARKVASEVQARSPRHQLVVDLPGELPLLEGDPELLAQVFRNLYENAVKYSPGGGKIVTGGTSDGYSVTLTVSDQGLGIAPDQVVRVFERFHRAGADPHIRGMGLGLYLCRLLIEAQDGRIAASSPGPGKGSTFSVTLPIAKGWS